LLHLAFVGVTISGDGSLDFAWGITKDFNVVLRGGEKDDTAHFGETQSCLYVESGENGFDGDHVRRKLPNEIANQGVDCFERGAGGFLAFFRDAQGAIVKGAAFTAFGFDNTVAGRACCSGVKAQYAHTRISWIHRHSVYGQAFACGNFFVRCSLDGGTRSLAAGGVNTTGTRILRSRESLFETQEIVLDCPARKICKANCQGSTNNKPGQIRPDRVRP